MSWAIGNIRNLVAVRAFFRDDLIQQIANSVHNVQVLLFVMTTDVVSLTRFALSHNGVKRTRMIFYIKPVTDLVAFAVNRQRFTVKGVQDHKWDQLLREMIRSVVIRTVSHDGREAVSAQPGTNKMVAGCFGGRVRAAWRVGCGFSEKRQVCGCRMFIRVRQIPVHFIGGDMMEAKRFFRCVIEG